MNPVTMKWMKYDKMQTVLISTLLVHVTNKVRKRISMHSVSGLTNNLAEKSLWWGFPEGFLLVFIVAIEGKACLKSYLLTVARKMLDVYKCCEQNQE